MTLRYSFCADWPPLAWLAICTPQKRDVFVRHGCQVETKPDWFCEAVWDGPFEDGDFDRTDIVAGSGARVRSGCVTFVSPGSTCDRLQYLEHDGRYYVSNSLVCLAAVVGAEFDPAYTGYHADINSVVRGLLGYRRVLRSSAGDIALLYFHNLQFDGVSLQVVEKPFHSRDFDNFEAYHAFLDGSMARIAANLADPARAHRYAMVAALSSGYDSTTVACLAARHGCRQGFSFDQARGALDDTGQATADQLGIGLAIFSRNGWSMLNGSEIPFIAADGHGEDRYYAAAGELLAGTVLFTGYHGDKVWDKNLDAAYLGTELKRGDASGLSLTEFRLERGVIHCPVPFWGARQVRDIHAISNQPEMAEWDVGGSYTRPICRRIAEGAGVPREAFGMRKKAASVLPHTEIAFATPQSTRDYVCWLRRRRWQLVRSGEPLYVISPALDRLRYGFVAAVERLARTTVKLMSRLPVLWRYVEQPWLVRGTRLVIKMRPRYIRKYMFPWAVEAAAARYQLEAAKDRSSRNSGS